MLLNNKQLANLGIILILGIVGCAIGAAPVLGGVAVGIGGFFSLMSTAFIAGGLRTGQSGAVHRVGQALREQGEQDFNTSTTSSTISA